MNGAELRQARDALSGAFNLQELDEMLLFRLDINRANVVAEGPMNTVVFRLLDLSEREGWTTDLIEAAYRERPRNGDIRALYQRHGLAPTIESHEPQAAGNQRLRPVPIDDNAGLERIVNSTNTLLNIETWMEKLAQVRDRVCRIEVSGSPAGTGFLVGPNAVMTNYHVLQAVIEGQASPGSVVARFDYKQLADNTILSGIALPLAESDWLIDHSPYSDVDLQANSADLDRPTDALDYALVRLREPAGEQKADALGGAAAPPRGWIDIPAAPFEFVADQPLFIVQHPKGTPLKLALDTDAIIKVNGNRTRVRYKTNTEPGSSGSPCFNQQWELVALHHYGDPDYFDPEYNQGIPVAAIRALLESRDKLGELS